MKKNKETKLNFDLFRMGWFCAQEVVTNVYQSNFSDILKYVTRLSFLGTVFKPDRYTASLQSGGEVVCKTKYETKDLGSVQVPEWTISTDYSYIGAKTFKSAIKLVLTPSLMLTLYEEEPDALFGTFKTTYTLIHDNTFYEHKVPEDDACSGSSAIEDNFLVLPEDNDYDHTKLRFSTDLSMSIIFLLQELDRDFKRVEKEVNSKREQNKYDAKTPVDLDTLLYSLAEKL